MDSDGVTKHSVRNINGRICINFARVLSCLVENEHPQHDITTYLFDERYTTKEAKIRLKQQNSKGIFQLFTLDLAVLLLILLQ